MQLLQNRAQINSVPEYGGINNQIPPPFCSMQPGAGLRVAFVTICLLESAG